MFRKKHGVTVRCHHYYDIQLSYHKAAPHQPTAYMLSVHTHHHPFAAKYVGLKADM